MKALLHIHTTDTDTHLVIPDSALTRCSDPFFPPFDGEWHAVVLRGVRINRLGKHIAPAFAHRYYNEYLTAVHPFAPGVETLTDCTSLTRDGALLVSPFIVSLTSVGDLSALVSFFSAQATLKTGDLILFSDYITPLPAPSANVDIPAVGPFPAMRLKIR